MKTAVKLAVVVTTLLAWAVVAVLPGRTIGHLQSIQVPNQIVRLVVEVEVPTTWMIVRVSEISSSPSRLMLTRSTPLMTARFWSYTLEMHDDMYVSATPLLYGGSAAELPGKGFCFVEVDGVEVPGSRKQVPGPGPGLAQCDYQII